MSYQLGSQEEEENLIGKPKKKYPAPAICTCLPFDFYPWMVLLCLCWVTFGSYWVNDTPGAIQTQITAWFGGTAVYNNEDNLTLYSVYSYPNIVLAFFGGYLIDNILGVRFGTGLFCSLVLFGQTIFAIGIQFRLYWLCVVGRFVFGLGGESLTVGQNYYTQRWFDGKILSFAFGLVVAFSRVGSSINFAITPTLAKIGVPFSVWFGTIMCLVSLVSCTYLAFFDWFGEARYSHKQLPKEEGISLLHVWQFSLQSWLIFLICVFFYVSVLTFYTVASNIMQNTGDKWDPERATFFLFIPNFVAIPASPLFGLFIDKKGYALWCLLVASVMQVVAHIVFLAMCLGWFNLNPAIIMVWIGIAYSMFAASVWPLLPFVIKQQLIGTGYGTMTAIQNAGLAIFPQVIGAIQISPTIKGTIYEYLIPIMIFICCAGTSFFLSLVLMAVDKKRTKGVLNAPGDVKQKYKKEVINAEPPPVYIN